MKNIVLLILFVVTLFIINILFYYNSDYYKGFIKGVKDGENFVVEETDKEKEIEERIGSIKERLLENQNKNSSPFLPQTQETKDTREIILEVTQQDDSIETLQLGRTYLEIVNLFSQYKLERLAINTRLFDITDEYPDDYVEYYSRGVTLYVFPTKSYEDVLDIFLVLEDELPFTVNITNNFGDNSFYINLNENIADKTVRMVISSQNRVFGLKIKNNEYNNVKEILKKLPTN